MLALVRDFGQFCLLFAFCLSCYAIVSSFLGGKLVNRRLVEEAGLVVERAEVLAEPEDRETARFLWVLARKPIDAEAAAASDHARRRRGRSKGSWRRAG